MSSQCCVMSFSDYFEDRFDWRNEVIILVILLFSAIMNGALLPPNFLISREIQLVRCLTRQSRIFGNRAIFGDIIACHQPRCATGSKGREWQNVYMACCFYHVSNINLPDKPDFIDRDGRYIILTQIGNYNILNVEFFWAV
jgi:hypothetical protein